jgi:hypothetical protein
MSDFDALICSFVTIFFIGFAFYKLEKKFKD